MNKLLFFLILTSLFLVVAPVQAQSLPISIFINGEKQNYDQDPVFQYGRTLVPMRGIFESLGAEVEWDGVERKITTISGNTKIELFIDSRTAFINDNSIQLDIAAQILNGRTIVPLRFVSEALGAEVYWEHDTRSVIINYDIEESQKIDEVDKEFEHTFLALNEPYISKDNSMTVTVLSINLVKLGDYNTYEMVYKEENLTDTVIEQGSFKVFYDDGESTPQYGFFGKLYPNEEVIRSYTFRLEVIGQKAKVFEYGNDLFFNKAPSNNTLKWEYLN